MVFSSITFMVFFLPLVLLFYFMLKNETYRNGVLIVFSLVFYAWGEPKWILIMLLTVLVNYLCGVMITRSDKRFVKKLWMLLGVCLGIGFLVYFKYFGFMMDSICSLKKCKNNFVSPVLHIDISFYTFQVLTYTIDVYKGKTKVQKNFFMLLLYVAFFPQLIAGPIVNYKDIEKQLKNRVHTLDKFAEGFIRFLIGFSKKILLANTCGEILQHVDITVNTSVLGAWLTAIAYTLQIYFDFSGYSDMAIGLGKMFGFEFLENFNYPYISKSITEFWRRWHISLGSFFREYVYIPLGGNRVSKLKQIRNIMIVWALTGIWHGASYNFLVWGLYYGVLLIIEKQFFLKLKDKIPAFINVIFTLPFVIIGWVIFYHIDMSNGLLHIGAMFGINAKLYDSVAIYYFKHFLGFLLIAIMASIPWKNVFKNKFIESPILKVIVVSLIAAISFAMLIGQSYNPFLYFRF